MIVTLKSDSLNEKKIQKIKKQLKKALPRNAKSAIVCLDQDDRLETFVYGTSLIVVLYSDDATEKVSKLLEKQLKEKYVTHKVTLISLGRNDDFTLNETQLAEY